MFGFYLFKYSIYSVIYLGIAAAGIANQKYIETVFLFIAFISLRYCFPRTFHSKSVYRCAFYSIMIFWIAIPHVLPITVSLFSSVIVGFIMTWILYLVQDYVDFKTKSEKTIFDLTRHQLEDILANSLLSLEEKDAIQYKIIEKLKGKYFYQAMGYSKRQSLRIYKTAVDKLNKLIQE